MTHDGHYGISIDTRPGHEKTEVWHLGRLLERDAARDVLERALDQLEPAPAGRLIRAAAAVIVAIETIAGAVRAIRRGRGGLAAWILYRGRPPS